MTKPVIVNRAVKDSPLTTAEHDANFANLQNATVGLQAGTAGTTVTSDLNGVITLVAGSGVTFTGDNTAKTITVTATASDILGANTINIGSDTGSDTFLLSNRNSLTVRSGEVNAPFEDSYSEVELTAVGQMVLKAVGGAGTNPRIHVESDIFKMHFWTDEAGFTYPTMFQLATSNGVGAFGVSPANGMMYYDTGVNKFKGYAGGVWVDLH